MNKTRDSSDTLLKDFDWNVKLSCSSDKISKLNEPLCNLHFYLNKTQNSNRKETNFEMNLNELNEFIQSLEKIQSKLEVFE